MRQDFKALWNTKFLEDLSVEKTEHTFENGTVGVMVVYRMEERERVKIVDYRNTKGESISIIKRSDIDEKLREQNIEVRLDSFLDEGSIRRVKGVLRGLMAEKGFTNAEINHKVTRLLAARSLSTSPSRWARGRRSRFATSSSSATTRISDGTLQKKLKENKPKGILSFITAAARTRKPSTRQMPTR
jgi:outer membrane protein assembly factor BamA